MSIYNYPFDQFQRYFTVAKIVTGLTSLDSTLKVLEVGANAHCGLQEFLPNADITFTDIDEQPVAEHVNFIQADATNLPFKDDEFDFVISTDVLEHVPAKLRKKFINECYRVAKVAFILACPIDNGETPQAESIANKSFKRLHGVDYIWLREHQLEGLPTIESIDEMVEGMAIPFFRFEHGRLDWWLPLMQMHFIKEAEAELRVTCSKMDEHYNRNLYQQDSGGACYRSFWVLGRDTLPDDCLVITDQPSASSIAEMNVYQNICVATENMSFTTQRLHESLSLNKQEAEQVKQELEHAEHELVNLSAELQAIRESASWKITMPLRKGSRTIRRYWHSIQVGLKNHSPLLVHVFSPIAGGFSARLSRAIGLLIKQGPKALFNKLKAASSKGETIPLDPNYYQSWLAHHHHQEQSDAAKLLKLLPIMQQPLISIVMPTYNTDEIFLRLCIESVLNQSYQNWELCIADDASPEPQVIKVLEEYQVKDKRIKIVCRKENGHISAASNSALELVTGEWTALLDHDDELHKHALAFVVNAINENPDVELVYSDEDKMDEQGNRLSPHFKPDWNLDLLYSQNYVSHLGVYKTDIVKKIGGFRVGLEGSQDYDLLLRYSREINQANIIHIPKALYHWRMVEGSTALAADEKSYTTEAGIKALTDHFLALDKKVTVERGMADNIYKVNWPAVNTEGNEPLVSLIMPTYNGYEITKLAIESILEKSTYQNFEILLVDNNSNEPISLEYFEEINKHEKVTLLRYPHPFNYSAINNFAAKHAKGEILGLVNNDIEVITPDWLSEMVSHVQREDIGCVGAMLYYPNDTIQHAGVIIGIQGVANHSHKHLGKGHPGYFRRLQVVQNFSAVTAACLLVRRVVFNEVNGLNEKDLTIAFNDIDFCLKVQAAGYRNLWTPYAELYHHESISRGAEDNPEKIARFNKESEYMSTHWKTNEILDFAYNPNLTIDHENFSLAWTFRRKS